MAGTRSASTGNHPGSPFVGREHELSELRAALASALGGQGRIVLLAGEPGIGKTRTAEEILTDARDRDALILWGRCQEWEGAPAYWPWLQILRRYVERTDEATVRSDLASIAGDLSQIMPELASFAPDDWDDARVAYSPEQRRFRLFDAMARLLRTVSSGQPVVLVLDDVHSADQPSLRLLEFVAQDVHGLPLLLIATYRNVELDRRHPLTATLAELSRDPASRRLILHGLSSDDVSRYIELTADRQPPSGLVDAVMEETEGNPFFVTEVVGWLRSEGRLDGAADEGRWMTRIPESIREAVGQRLNRLSPETNETLTVAAVIGREFDLPLLARATERETLDLLDHLDEAVQADVIDELEQPGAYRFSHALIRETLYGELTTSRRLRLNSTVGAAIEELHAGNLAPHYGELAHHFSESALAGNAEKAIDYATRAGDQAMEKLAWESAVESYRQAQQVLSHVSSAPLELRCSILLALSRATWFAGDARSGQALALEASELAREIDDPFYIVETARAYTSHDLFPAWATDQLAVTLIEQALERVGDDVPTVRADLFCRLALYLPSGPDSSIARRAAAREAVLAATKAEDDTLLVRALFAQSFSLNDGDDAFTSEVARMRARLLARIADKPADARRYGVGTHLLVWIGFSELLYRDDYRIVDLFSFLEQIRSLNLDFGSITKTWDEYMLELLLLLTSGKYQETLKRASQIRDMAIANITVHFDPWLGEYVYRAVRELGAVDTYIDQIERFIETDPDYRTLWQCRHIVAQAETGRVEDAWAAIDALVDESFASIHPNWNWLLAMVTLAEVIHTINHTIAAAQIYEKLIPYLDLNAITLAGMEFLGSVSYYLGLLATTLERWDDAEEHFRFALERHEKMELPPYIANTQHQYAAMLVRRARPGDLDRARELNERALTAARGMGMLRLERLAAALAEQIDTHAHMTAPDGAPYGLTPREFDVLVRLVRGGTDREIADELSISHRTVMVHVSNILGKLGASSRTAAAAIAIREGLV